MRLTWKKLLGLVLFGLALLVAVPLIAMAQSTSDEQQKSVFLRFVQDRLSTPERLIRISNIDGALSSDASINEITVSDNEGVWLRITKARINWNQGALFTGRLEINTLSAESIDVIRNPKPAGGVADLPSPEAKGLEIPQLPVAVILKQLSVPKVTFEEQVFGLGSQISVDGSLTLDGGSLDTKLAIKRLDGPGGALDLAVKYTKATNIIDLALTVTEPKDGIIANLLNIEGRPDVHLSLNGSGPVANLKTQLTLDAGGKRALTGLATVQQVAQGFAIETDLRGPIADLVTPAFRDFFGTETALTADALLRKEGGLTINALKLTGGELTLDASGATGSDWFLTQLSVNGVVTGSNRQKALLPIPGADTRIDSAQLAVNYGGPNSQAWSGKLSLAGFENGVLSAKTVQVTGSGAAANLDQPTSRRITFNGDGVVDGVTAKNPDIQAALGTSLGFGFAGLWNAGQPVQLAQFRLTGKALSLDMSGTIDKTVFSGNVGIKTSSLAPFSGIAGRNLSGALDLTVKGTISPLIGGFDLTLDGTGTNLTVDSAAADRVLAGDVKLTGGLARDAAGIKARQFRISNAQVNFLADGAFATGAANFNFNLDLADLGLLSPQAKGPLAVVGTAKGQQGTIALNLDAKVSAGSLEGKPLQNGALTFAGTLANGALAGKISGDGFLDGFRVALASGISVSDTGRQLSALNFTAGGTRITGDLTQRKDGLYEGQLKLAASDVSTAAALVLVKATGAANANIGLSVASGKQNAMVGATVRNLNAADVVLGSADIAANVADLFGVPVIDGTAAGSNISAAGIDFATLNVKATRTGQTTAFDATASLKTNTDIAVAGSLTPLGQGYRLALDRASLKQGALSAQLAAPAALAVNGKTVTMDSIRFDVGTGQVTATGSAGDALNIALQIRAVPLSIANAIAPKLALAGTVDGTANITGSGTDPRASFNVTGSGLNAAAMRDFGVAPLNLTANGSYAGKVVQLAAFRATGGASGLTLSGSGTVPLAGNGLAVDVRGSAPLSLANRFVADRGGQASGTVTIAARVTGSTAVPRFAGTVSTSGAQYVDPALNLRLVGITGSASLNGDSLNISTLSARLATGGSVDVGGSVSLRGAYPANLRLRLNAARYAEGSLFVATVSGTLTLTGPITQGALLAGDLRVQKADITVPERIGGGPADINVKHVRLPKDVALTLARAMVDSRGRPVAAGGNSPLRLDVNLTAPNQVFIRGRGLDAEVGGSVRLTGPVTAIQPVGAFRLIRGRLLILGQRITFNSGTVTLTGNLDPQINLIAQTQGDNITVIVTVSGRASDLKVDFSSSPQLPQDEVLSRLIFKRSMGELSPLQLARLAGAAADLAGGSNNSLIDSLRKAAGLDQLDVITDPNGNAALAVGRYVQDNVYLGVQAGANGDSRVTVDLDITSDLKARASAGADGNSSVGVFYQKDY